MEIFRKVQIDAAGRYAFLSYISYSENVDFNDIQNDATNMTNDVNGRQFKKTPRVVQLELSPK